MAVEWVDPDSVTAAAGNEARSADFNSALQDLKYLHDPPRCKVRLNASQSVANATDHAITWPATVWDSHGDMWIIGSPTRVTITRDGVYTIVITPQWFSDVDGTVWLEVNGDLRAGPIKGQLVVETNLADGDYLEAFVRQTSGAAVNLLATRTTLSVRWSAAPPVSGE